MNNSDRILYKGVYSINLDKLFKCKCKINDATIILMNDKMPVKRKCVSKILSIPFKTLNGLLFKTKAKKYAEIKRNKKKCEEELKKYNTNNKIYALFKNEDIFTEVVFNKDIGGDSEITYTYGANKIALIVKDKMQKCLHTNEFNRSLIFIYKDDNKETIIGKYTLARIKLFNKFIYHTFGEVDLVKFLYNIYTEDDRRIKLNV